MSKSVPAVAIPIKTIESMWEEMVQRREVVSCFIKHYAPKIEIGDWETSQMPELILAYGSYAQLLDYLDKKLSDQNSMSGEGILFAEQELLLLTEAVRLADTCKNTLKVKFNISLEVH